METPGVCHYDERTSAALETAYPLYSHTLRARHLGSAKFFAPLILLLFMSLPSTAQEMTEQVECHLPSGMTAELNRLNCRQQNGLVLRTIPTPNLGDQNLQRAGPSTSAKTESHSPSPEEPIRTRPLPSGLIASIQFMLIELGFDAGPADGLPGSKTNTAIRDFERSRGLPITGQATVQMEAALKAAVAARSQVVKRTLVPTGTGSGFFVDSSGHIVTNSHVVEGCDDLKVYDMTQSEGGASVQTQDKRNDLALLLSDRRGLGNATLRANPPVEQGDMVIAAGFPLAGLLSAQVSITIGNVSALFGIHDDSTQLTITAPIQPGNSGGPLLDLSGNVVGVNFAMLDAAKLFEVVGALPQNVNFAINVETLKSFLSASAISYQERTSSVERKPSEIGRSAREFTVRISCLQWSSE